MTTRRSPPKKISKNFVKKQPTCGIKGEGSTVLSQTTTGATTMKNLNEVNQAITNNNLIKFSYGGADRVVEGYTVVNGLLSAYQVSCSDPNKPAGWRSFRVNQMRNLQVQSATFSPRETGTKNKS